jgi:hypothetical protein
MLKLTILGDEFFDETTETFSSVDDIHLELEHSLLTVSKWESLFEKPFLANNEKTPEETLGYVDTMIISPKEHSGVTSQFTQEHLDAIDIYINSNQSATTFGEMPQRGGRGETITSELIYYWMVAFNIPFECESWHINRLFSLIRICNIKQSKPKKMGRTEMANRNAELNARRKAEYNTTG